METDAEETVLGGLENTWVVSDTRLESAQRGVLAFAVAPPYVTRLSSFKPADIARFGVWSGGASLLSLIAIWWHGLDLFWMAYWFGAALLTGAAAVVIGQIIRRRRDAPHGWDSIAAQVVRGAAMVGDERIAPLAKIQPTSTDAAHVATEPARIEGLYPSVALNALHSDTFLITLFNLPIALGVGITGLVTSSFDSLMTQTFLLIALFLIFILWQQFKARRATRAFSVVADAEGVTWRQRGKQHTLAWSEAQALCMIERPRYATTPTQRFYWLQTPDGALVWASRPFLANWLSRWLAALVWTSLPFPLGASPALRRQRRIPLAEYDQQAWRFCALAAARTGLPLRDMSAICERVAKAQPRIGALWRELAPDFDFPLSQAEQRRIATWRATRLRRLRIVTAALAALTIVTLASGLGLLVGAPWLYSAQLQQAQLQPPLFADSLAAPTGHWPDPTAPGATFTYKDGALVPSDNFCCDLLALATPAARDSVVEVTIHFAGGNDYDSSGIILRADQARHSALAFSVTSGGAWELQRFTLGADGRSGELGTLLIYEGVIIPMFAIHRGSDVVNRLAVIMRGDSFAFFVNGQYLGSYHDIGNQGDQVGVYTDGLSDSVAFSDFATYPAPPASPLFPV